MKQITFISILMLSFLSLNGQNITTIEYFFDSDPGVGNGTPVAITPAPTLTNFSFGVNISAITDGFHTLFIRARDANNKWSVTYSKPFYKLSSPVNPPLPDINKVEYFFDNDPGYGAGVNVPVIPATTIPNLSFNAPASALSVGTHLITVRARDANNKWSIVFYKSFSVCNHPTTTVSAAASVTSSGFTINWSDVSGSINYQVDVSTDNFSTFVSGYNSKLISAPALTTTITGLSQATAYQFRVRAVASCTSVESNVVNVTTLATAPTAQPTSLQFTSITTSSYTAFFTAPAATPTGYLVVRKIASSPTFVPSNNVAYTQGQAVGDGTAAYIGPAALFNESSLPSDTRFFYDIFSYNQVGASITYLPTSPLENSVSTFALEPVEQPTSLTFSSVTDAGFNSSFSPAVGNPAGYIVLRKVGSAPLSVPVDGTLYTSTVGTDAVVYNGAALSFPQSGLTQNTQYYYTIYSYNGSGTSINYRTTLPLQGSQLTAPAAQPTNLQFTSITPSSYTASFSAPGAPPTGYLVVRKVASSPTFVPSINVAYTQGQTVGDGTVAYAGTTAGFGESGLSPDTRYFYDIFSFSQVGAAITYLSTTPLENSVSTLAPEPTAQPTNLVFSSVTDASFNVAFSTASGTPAGYIVLRKIGSAPSAIPADGTVYSSTVGPDAVVSNGAGISFAQSALSQNTQYYYTAYAYNGSGSAINYRTVTPLQGSQVTAITPPSAPTNLAFTNVTASAMKVSFTTATGPPSGYLVVRKIGSSPTFLPQINTGYSAGQTVGDGVVAYFGSAVTFDESSLNGSTTYFYDVFAFNQQSALVSYQTAPPLEGSKTTFTAEPTSQPSSFTLSNTTSTSHKVSFTAANPVASGYLVIRKVDATPSTPPTDGNGYFAGDVIGDGLVAYSGPGVTFDDTGLAPGTNYFYQVFAFNGSGVTSNYLTAISVANSGSGITVPGKPVLLASTLPAQTGFTIKWNAVTGATTYKLDVSKDNFVTLVPGFDNVTVSGTSKVVTGLETGLPYKYRVRAANSSGISVNSDDGQQFVIPATPTFNAATAVGQTTFAANWPSVTGAEEYFIDVSADEFSTFVINYNNKSLGQVNTAAITGLLPGKVYSYRLRSANTGGVSTSTSPANTQLTFPETPIGIDDPNATQSSFKANWQTVESATEYRLDVSLKDNNFSPSLPDYTDRLVTGRTNELVNDLQSNATYRFRLRAVNGAGTSPSSDYIDVKTLQQGSGSGSLGFSDVTFNSSSTAAASDISATVTGGTSPYTVVFYSRKITEVPYTPLTLTNPTVNKYTVTIQESASDEIGLEFYFKVTDAAGGSQSSAKKYIYRTVPAAGIKIPFTRFGGTAESYEIFSIPYSLSTKLVGSIFDEFNELDKKRWRLVRYQGGKNIDVGLVGAIEPGKSYWFNRKENIDVTISAGTSVNVSQADPFLLELEKGWNQIGNPYPFDVNWTTILKDNPSLNLVGPLKVFNPVGLHLNDESATLKSWGGGFVFNGHDQSVTLKLLPTLRNSSGRMVSPDKMDGATWVVPINTQQGNSLTARSAIGMHPNASRSLDPHDDIIVPRFLNFLELYTQPDGENGLGYASDIVPDATNHTWNFHFASSASGKAILHWDNGDFNRSDGYLVLYDASASTLVDMRSATSYTFTPANNQSFKIIYARTFDEILPDVTRLGVPYPSPFTTSATIPILIGKDQSHVVVKVVDMLGRPIALLTDGKYTQGIHYLSWNGADQSGASAAPGMYLVRMEADGYATAIRVIKH